MPRSRIDVPEQSSPTKLIPIWFISFHILSLVNPASPCLPCSTRSERVSLPTSSRPWLVVTTTISPRCGGISQHPAAPCLEHTCVRWLQPQQTFGRGILTTGSNPNMVIATPWTSTNWNVISSTAETSLYACNRAAIEGWEFKRLPKTRVKSSRYGCTFPVRFYPMVGLSDANEIQHSWLQEAVRNKLLVDKVSSNANSCDMDAKHLTSERSEMVMKLVESFYMRHDGIRESSC